MSDVSSTPARRGVHVPVGVRDHRRRAPLRDRVRDRPPLRATAPRRRPVRPCWPARVGRPDPACDRGARDHWDRARGAPLQRQWLAAPPRCQRLDDRDAENLLAQRLRAGRDRRSRVPQPARRAPGVDRPRPAASLPCGRCAAGVRKTRVCRSSSGRARTASSTLRRARPSCARRHPSRARRLRAQRTRSSASRAASSSCRSCGAATTLLALNACSDEESTQRPRAASPAARFAIPTTATTDPDAARAALAGDEFVFDVQGHFLEYHVDPPTRRRGATSGWASRSSSCGETDPTAVLLDQSLHGRGVPQERHVDDRAVRPADRTRGQPDVDAAHGRGAARCRARCAVTSACCCRRRRSRTSATCRRARRDGSDAGERTRSWRGRCSPTSPTSTTAPGTRGDSTTATPHSPQVGDAFIEQAVELGVPVITAHKGLSTTLGYTSPHASPADFGPAAKAHPEVRFVAYHSGFEAERRRGSVRRRRRANVGVNRLITHHARRRRRPEPERLRRARHHVVVADEPTRIRPRTCSASCSRHVGEDNVLWGTDCIFYGVAAGPDPGVPRLPDQRGVPGALRLPRADRRDQAQGARPERAALAQRRPDRRAPCTFTRDELETDPHARSRPRTRPSARAPPPSCARTSLTSARRAASSAPSRSGSCPRARRG